MQSDHISQGRPSIQSNANVDPNNQSAKSAQQLEEMLMKTNKDNLQLKE